MEAYKTTNRHKLLIKKIVEKGPQALAKKGLFLGLVLLAFGAWGQAFPPKSIVVVGQHSCPACQAALHQLPFYLHKWEARGLAVHYYSLDAQPQDYSDYPLAVSRLPQRWEDPLIKALGTYATPSYYWINAQGEVRQETATAAEMQLALLAHPHSKTKGP